MNRENGFTLTELMVVTGLIAILSAITIPNMIGWASKNRLSGASREIYSILQLSRSAAVKENTRVAILFDQSGRIYKSFADNGAQPGNWVMEADEPLIAHGELPPGIYYGKITCPSSRVRFNPDGVSNIACSIALTNNSHANRKIVLSRLGRVRIEIE